MNRHHFGTFLQYDCLHLYPFPLYYNNVYLSGLCHQFIAFSMHNFIDMCHILVTYLCYLGALIDVAQIALNGASATDCRC